MVLGKEKAECEVMNVTVKGMMMMIMNRHQKNQLMGMEPQQ